MSVITEKQALRQTMRTRRAVFAADHMARTSHMARVGMTLPPAIMQRIGVGSCVALYVALGDEPSPDGLLAECLALGAILALPWHADRQAAMQFVHWTPGDATRRGPFGTMQPEIAGNMRGNIHQNSPEYTRENTPENTPENTGGNIMVPDIILCPLLAFDRMGRRLGQGGGHYDGAFARFTQALRIGVAWSCQLVDAVPCEPHDVMLHGVLTERGFTATAVR